jgi:hypothetical protein
LTCTFTIHGFDLQFSISEATRNSRHLVPYVADPEVNLYTYRDAVGIKKPTVPWSIIKTKLNSVT